MEVEIRQQLHCSPYEQRKDIWEFRLDALFRFVGIGWIGVDDIQLADIAGRQDRLQRCLVRDAAVGVKLRNVLEMFGNLRIEYNRLHGGICDRCDRRGHDVFLCLLQIRLRRHAGKVCRAGLQRCERDKEIVHRSARADRFEIEIVLDVFVVERSVVEDRINAGKMRPLLDAVCGKFRNQLEDFPPAHFIDVIVLQLLPLRFNFFARSG